jgi:hypothetical protein
LCVIPAQVGDKRRLRSRIPACNWLHAYAGMTHKRVPAGLLLQAYLVDIKSIHIYIFGSNGTSGIPRSLSENKFCIRE